MSKYAPLTLRAIAAITSATSAAAAYPAASNLFGMLPGGVMVASSAAVIFGGWHIVATSGDTDHRIVSGVTAALFAGVMTVGIHSSGQLKTATQATSTAEQADTLYMNQESTRMATLATVAAELRATQKSKYPAEYAALQAQVDKLSTPAVRTPTASQEATATTGSIQQWIAASVFEIVTPALLLLAGMFSHRKQRDNTALTPVNSALTQEKQEVVISALTDPLTALTDDNTALTAADNELTDPLTALTRRSIEPTSEGFITAKQVISATNCTDRQARDAIKQATDDGILESIGSGNATRYRYSNKLRIVK
ncbi:hypothetical protein [Thiothrix fructosivorans]|uniref:Uncharacterized protein n=1 Tax=Thiothrix fructosivorans TaxID=111770 RepID=A0A8B0SFN7_9GAMM|nr:hypothetical protein [Thiothrix fructosivorans]MBO0613693.1 hypothetical protein [Thiothrix fructosivorans]QTX10893.1 hypothetical protein J1836_000495 [Thiothrix fructosivorans]